jgi:hypothetical protein
VQGDDVRPKSIAREMYERFMDFNEYVREYELGRAEGTLLRYLSDAYKALVQTVPAPDKTPEVEEIEVFLRAMVRAVDSSLLDEWERIRDGARDAAVVPEPPPDDAALGEVDVTQDERGFTVLVRNAMFQLLRALARKDWAAASGLGDSERGGLSPEETERALAPFFAEHSVIRLDPRARASDRTVITRRAAEGTWDVVQLFSELDDDAASDVWAISCQVDLPASAAAARPVFQIHGVSR